jgi:hypothetical protein
MKAPRELDIFADVVLNYHPPTQQKKSGKRRKRAEKRPQKRLRRKPIKNKEIARRRPNGRELYT